MMESVRWLSLALLFLVISPGCRWETPSRPSVLIVAVESLGFPLVSCHEAETSGFSNLCEQSVRFTHAYTPSVMAQPALASLLTALYPFEHLVRHNGSDFLSAKFETVAEAAKSRGYATSFFSGGPPIWSKSGLGQGMDLFEDQIKVDLNRTYRPAQENFEQFLAWLDQDAKTRPFLSVLYVPDLQFPRAQTRNDMGEPRELSLTSQIREIDESLSYLMAQLQKRGVWEKTHFVVTGLNGSSAERRQQEFKGINLHSENTQVALFIKPSGKKRDLPMSWKVDANISLVDVGATLFDVIDHPIPKPTSARRLEVRSLKGVLAGEDFADSQDRLILSESAWTAWHNQDGIRYAIRRGEYLLLWEAIPKMFNTLTDRFETTALTDPDSKALEFQIASARVFRDQQLLPWSPPQALGIEKMVLASELFSGVSPDEDLVVDLERLARGHPRDTQLGGWLARLHLREGHWRKLLSLAKRSGEPLWEYVAQRNLGQAVPAPQMQCFEALTMSSAMFHKSFPKKCEDPLLSLFLSWLHAPETRSRESAREKFLRAYRYTVIDQTIAEQNYAAGLMWDVAAAEPAGPSPTELALALPENTKYQDLVRRRLLGPNPETTGNDEI